MRKNNENEDVADIHSVSQAISQAESFLDIDSESVTVQEAHHAMHVLTFFLFMMNLADKQQPIRKTLVDRVIYHLLNLREFIQDNHLADLVTELSAAMSIAYDDFFPANAHESHHTFAVRSWLERHEDRILELAKHYGKESVFEPATRAA